MKRFWLYGAAAVALLGVAGASWALLRRPVAVPLAVVVRGDFARWVPADGVLRSAQSIPLSIPPEIPDRLRIAWIAPEGTRVQPGDVVLRFDPTELQRKLEDSGSDLAGNRLKVDKERTETTATLANLDRDERGARSELEHADTFASKDVEIFSRNEILESQIDRELSQARLEHTRSARRREERVHHTDLELLAIERRKIELELDRAQRGVVALAVQAPIAGLLVYRRDWRGEPPRVGEDAFPGQPLVEIPNLAAMEVEAYVLEADAGGLADGKSARVSLESAPDRLWPARVATVDSLAKPRFRNSPVQYFALSLSFDEPTPGLKPGQRVKVELLLEEAKNVLQVPRQAIFDQGEKTVVYRRRGGSFEPVVVKVMSSGMGRAVVEGELEAGDAVALEDPTRPPGTPRAEPSPPSGPPGPSGGGGGRMVIVGGAA